MYWEDNNNNIRNIVIDIRNVHVELLLSLYKNLCQVCAKHTGKQGVWTQKQMPQAEQVQQRILLIKRKTRRHVSKPRIGPVSKTKKGLRRLSKMYKTKARSRNREARSTG